MIRTIAALLLFASVAQAEKIDLTFTSLDLVYDGGVLRDANPDGPSFAFVTIDDDSIDPANVVPTVVSAELDLYLPSVSGLEVNGAPAVSGPGGWLTVAIPGGDSIHLTLDEVQISYTDQQGIAVFGNGTEGSALSPSGSSSEPGASVVFSATISSQSVDNNVVGAFDGKATGQVTGATLVPEPATGVVVGLLALVGSAAAAMRANLG